MRWFVRRHGPRVATFIVVITTCYVFFVLWLPFQREQQISAKIKSAVGRVSTRVHGPKWIPESIRMRIPPLNRVHEVYFVRKRIEQGVLLDMLPELKTFQHLDSFFLQGQPIDTGMEHLRDLKRLKSLMITNNPVSDADLEYLKGMAKLEWLDLHGTTITDSGLEHLKGLTSLTDLDLSGTDTTEDGRATLKKSLPNCEIRFDP